jgi:hypothetical protein
VKIEEEEYTKKQTSQYVGITTKKMKNGVHSDGAKLRTRTCITEFTKMR